jgi:bifunctional non-homologous end joining protein LigD
MLAASGRPTTPLSGWAVEPKFDGWRAMAEVDGGRVCVTSRNGHDLTRQVPSVEQLAGRRLVLDGEIICDAGTMNDFYALLRALRQRRAVLVAFDVLQVDDRVLVTEPYDARRAVLEQLDLPGVTVPSYPGEDLDVVLGGCESGGMEGVVLKRRRSIYRAGQRSSDWRKVKCAAWEAHLKRRMADHP